jgi:myo-inositol catabolism protein IolS
MIKRPLGRTGLNTSAIGLGTWNIGGQWGAISDEQAIATIHAAIDAGVNLIDTADAYGEPAGRSEELIARAIVGRRDGLIIATKVGNFARRQGHALAYTHPLHVELCCDASLQRMKIDTIDFYQCNIGNLADYSVFLEAFDTLRKKGKIRFGGVSTNSLDAVKAFDRDGTCEVVQLDYSLLNRAPEKDILPYCLEKKIAVLVRGPLAQGVAAGKFDKASVFDDSVRKGWNEGPAREKLLARIDTIDRIKSKFPGRDMAQVALQFVISHPAVSAAIPGAKSPDQARANAAAGTARLTEESLKLIHDTSR